MIEVVLDLTTAAANCATEFVNVLDGIKSALKVADKMRSIADNVSSLYDSYDKTKPLTPGQISSVLKVIGDAKGAAVEVYDFFKNKSTDPVSTAIKIAKCLEAILASLDNVCGRIISNGDHCSTVITRTVCAGIALVKTQLGKVNSLIEAAKKGVERVSLALVCSMIDQVATAFGIAGQQPKPVSPALPIAPGQLTLASAATPDADTDPTLALLQALLDEIAVQLPHLQAIQDLNVGYSELNAQTFNLDQVSAKMFSSEVAGLPANTYYLITAGDTEIRGQTGASGRLEVFLPASTLYTLSMYDPATNRVANVSAVSAESGRNTVIPAVAFASLDVSNLPFDADGARIIPAYMVPDGQGGLSDRDNDGLADVAERIVGTSLTRADTDRDGLNDFAELQQGQNPLDGQVLATGVVGIATLRGTAEAVAVAPALDGLSAAVAVVATGSYGVALVDTGRLDAPTVLAELPLPGTSIDVAVDAVRGIAAVAAGAGGLHLIDITLPRAPVLLQTVSLGLSVDAVEVRDGIAYALAGSTIHAVDLNTGEVRATLASPSGLDLRKIALDGNMLYTLDVQGRLQAVSIDGDVLTALGSLVVAQGGGGLFVGGGVAYIGRDESFNAGFSTVGVADPANLVLISGIDNNSIAGHAMAATGSGQLLTIGTPGNLNVLDLVGVRDPADTGNFRTRVALPSAPKDITLANGLAFVAGGAGGLQVVNFVAFDVNGQAPTASLDVAGFDIDPVKPGVQVVEGTVLTLKPTVTDDVQVRNIDAVVNGLVVASDLNFPFDLQVAVPTIAVGGSTLSLQIRATDTGGNVGQSTVQVLDVVADTFAPQLRAVNLTDGASVFFVRSINLVFNEPIDSTLFSTGAASLVRLGDDGVFGTADDEVMAFSVDYRASGQSVSILPDGYLPPGTYRFTVDAGKVTDRVGNALAAAIVRNFTVRPASEVRAAQGTPDVAVAPSANPGQEIGVPVSFNPANARMRFVIGNDNSTSTTRQDVTPRRIDAARGIAYFVVPSNAVSGDVILFSQVGQVQTFPPDGVFPLQIVPVVTDAQVQSIAADGSSAVVVLSGLGFTEGLGEYRFGSVVVTDAATNAGADVTGNGTRVTLTVPLSDGAFGAVSVKTAGGTSALYTVNLGSVQAVAYSGAPADGAQASANAGQTVKLVGVGLSTATDVLLRWVDHQGTAQMVRLNPSQASADGTNAQLDIPAYANGAFKLQVLGSASQPLLQIVPVVRQVDIQDRVVLFGSGYVEGASTYRIAGASHTDTLIDAADPSEAVNVWYDGAQNNSVYIRRAAINTFGAGAVTVSTAGGTSAAVALNVIRVDVAGTALSDVAVDAQGKLWVIDTVNPGHLQQIEPSTGAVLKTVALDAASFGNQYTGNYAGLQVLGQAMVLGSTAVPAGSLLLVSGYYYNAPPTVVAINPGTGAVLARLELPWANQYLTGGLYDAASGHLFVLQHQSNQMAEVDPTTGAQIALIALPAGVNIQSWAGMAIDPVTGNLWVGGVNDGAVVHEIRRDGALVRAVNLSAQGINENEISGLVFDAAGKLLVSSTQGVVYKVDVNADGVATPTATLAQVNAQAADGTPANAGQASANVGDVIELVGTNFSSATSVLFKTRDATGVVRTEAVSPLLTTPDGTRLQVRVPQLATTADIRVVNRGAQNLGFGNFGAQWVDSIYRKVSVSFTAGAASSVVRFTDGGLEDLSNESWGLDNVVVRQGATKVFEDNFEAGAKANWSSATTDNTNATFSRFSGRFNNASQVLNLAGLTAGQTYTLEFDLYAIDSWEGLDVGNIYGPDYFRVIVDGTTLLNETLANYPENGAQTLNASAGIRLQVVPKLVNVSNSRPGEDGNYFYLNGSGFMEGATTVTVGGVVQQDRATNDNPIDIDGASNNRLGMVAPRSLDGPIRVATEGGFDELASVDFGVQPIAVYTGITASTTLGAAQDGAQPSATTGQTIVLNGQGFSNSTLVQFRGIDDTGKLGTLTRTGSAGAGGTTLSVVVPALAKTGQVVVLGSNAGFNLQVVPTLKAVGGAVATGNTIVLQGTGLTRDDLVISIDGRTVGNFTVRTLVDGDGNNPDQQLVTVVVPAGIATGVITVSTAGGASVLRTTVGVTSQAALSPATDVGDTIATALNSALNQDSQVSVSGAITAALDVDLIRVEMGAGDELALNMVNAASLYTNLRIFDAAGVQQAAKSPYFSPGNTNTVMSWIAPAAGTYYVGISGYNNNTYTINTAGSGNNGSYQGAYTLSLERLQQGNRHLAGISAGAASGTAANAGVASANTGQTITLNATGLQASDRVVFTTMDTNGNLGETAVTPAAIDVAAGTLTVVVPATATTGAVRLERDRSGIVLQIVPTISNLIVNTGVSYEGASMQLVGTGYAEGQSTVLFGDQGLADASRNYGLDVVGSNTQLNLGVSSGLPTGPIQVRTAGGTSAVYAVALQGLSATATTGTAVNAAQASANPGQLITLSGQGLTVSTEVVFDTINDSGVRSSVVVTPSFTTADGSIQVYVPTQAVSGVVRVAGSAASFALQIVPVVSDVQLESVTADGSSAVVLVSGLGFTEAFGDYRFGTTVVTDASSNAGVDVFSSGTRVRLTVPLSDGAFGAVSVKTAGGTSALYTVNLGSVQAVAYSGAPADGAQASANAGQTVKLVGVGLSTATDVLLRWVDHQGTAQMVRLNPSQASADGTNAQLDIPAYANGAFKLQVLGSASQPLLQIVPVVRQVDIQDRVVLFGSGYVEGASTYRIAGASHTDTLIDAADPSEAVNVWYDGAQNNSVYIRRAAINTFGAGAVTVSTAGGTSAAVALNVIRVDVAGTALSDVAVDAQGKLWVIDTVNPGHLQQIEPSTGAVLKTVALDAASFGNQYTGNYAGLQVLGQAMVLGSTAVPAGSLLLVSGYYYNAPPTVVAINPGTGAVLARLELPWANQYLTGGLYDAASGHLFVLQHQSNQMAEVDPTTGAQIALIALPAGVNIQSWAGMAIDPVTGNLWVGGVNDGAVVHEIRRDGALVRAVNLSAQGINENEISGLVFDAAGKLLVSSTQGVVYKVDVNADGVATPTATLAQVNAQAADGTPANAGQASANVGDVIELVGTNFSSATSVLFKTRDATGVVRTEAVSPLLTTPDGTRLQVRVPQLATTADIRVVNRGAQNLGFGNFGAQWVDSIYRKVSVSFTAGAASSVVRFTDGGLEDLSNESWGLDNVVVRQGATKVFEDNFEAGAKANWSSATTDNTNATFSRFSGRFNNASQVLNLAGLTAGQTYTLEFDLYAIDSWEGLDVGNIYGPDYFRVIVDGTTLLNETLANYPENGAQTLNASAGIRLQVVPKLVNVSNSRPGEDGNYFYLNGSGFMEGATTVTVGGVVQQDRATNDNPIDIDGASNNRLGMVAPRSLDGPIRVATEGGFDELASVDFGVQPIAVYTGITASTTLGAAQDGAQPSATTGQTIVLNGQGFSNSTLVQFRGIDDTGKLGTLTRTGSAGAGGTTLSVVVPALAKTGQVVVLGSNAGFNLQVVPTLKAVGGAVATGNTIVLQGTGLTRDDLVISIDGRTVGNFTVRTLVDGDGNNPDQQLVTVVVPAGIATGVITVSTAGGASVLRTTVGVTSQAALSPATDVGDTIATALNSALNQDSQVSVSGAITAALDVDLIRVEMGAGDELALNMVNAASLYTNLRIFDAAGVQQAAKSPYFSPGNTNTVMSWIAPAAGTYYVGISGYNNNTYTINTAGSGNNGSYQGAYTLSLERLQQGNRHLAGISAGAASGTAANAGVASANTGQTITLNATGLQASDRVVFTTMDTNGNLGETAVTPAAIDVAAGTLTVVVPATATTGAVRLERDRSGIVLQIVPTISAYTANGGTSFTLSGTGFADGATSLLYGDVLQDDQGRYYGFDEFSGGTRLNVVGPDGVSRSVIRVSTAGGISTAFITGQP